MGQRASDLGLSQASHRRGWFNAITDVPGVRVGQVTLIEGTDIRTGVTAIVPDAVDRAGRELAAGLFVGNGFGKLIGATQLAELGTIETPIVLTGTLSAFRAADALVSYMLRLPGNERMLTVNPIVGETNDGYLSDIRARPVSEQHVLAALGNARAGAVQQGCVGAGTGTAALGFKAGIGTASRTALLADSSRCTVGALVQSNFSGTLSVHGVRIDPAQALGSPPPGDYEQSRGSVFTPVSRGNGGAAAGTFSGSGTPASPVAAGGPVALGGLVAAGGPVAVGSGMPDGPGESEPPAVAGVPAGPGDSGGSESPASSGVIDSSEVAGDARVAGGAGEPASSGPPGQTGSERPDSGQSGRGPASGQSGRGPASGIAEPSEPNGNSCMIIIAVDRAIDARQLTRVAKRAVYAMGTVGSDFAPTSGDYAIAFSTAVGPPIAESALGPLFSATAEAVAEAILDSLVMATTMTGYQGRVRHAVPVDYMLAACQGRLTQSPATLAASLAD